MPDLKLDAPEPVFVALAGFGLLIALVVWLPHALKRLPLSLPIVCIAIGAAIFSLPETGLAPLPMAYPQVAERFTEFVVIIALMGAGLKLDRIFSWRRWGITWRLLGITMPLSIAAMTLLGLGIGLPLAAALLLGAALAPTDPVLASDVQVGPPKTGEEDEVRFGLTSEAGLNDGLAFPFIHLAILLATYGTAAGTGWLGDWALLYVGWKIIVGVGAGWLIGKLVGWLTFTVPAETKLAQTGDGLIAIAATLFAYGITEIAYGYGFLAVFVAALTIRASHRSHEFNRDMHDITEQIERIAMMVLLILLGGAIVSGVLDALQPIDIAFAVVVLLVVRPLAGLIGLAGFPASPSERMTIAFFGIRGVGSFYYLAYALNHAEFAGGERLWAIMSLIVLLSIIMHGLTVTPIMRAIDRKHGRDPDALYEAEPAPQSA